MDQLYNNIQKMRQAVIEAGGRPSTLRVSKKAIEGSTIFGMKIIIVDELPKDIFLMVSDDSNIVPKEAAE